MESSINASRTLGVEIEFVLPILSSQGSNLDVQQLVATVLSSERLPSVARSYSPQPVPSGHIFAVEHDSSLRDETRYGGTIKWAKLETKSRPLTWPEFESVMPTALEVIRYLGARCNVSTGLHVHHGVPEIVNEPRIARNLSHFWWGYHRVLYGLVAPSRQHSQYCRPPVPQEASRFDRIRDYDGLCRELSHCDRYGGMNLLNLANRERLTVEWRLHSGTTEWDKIKSWVLATQRWTDHAIARSIQLRSEPVANTRAGLNALLVSSGLKPNNRVYAKVHKELRGVGKYLLRRWRTFNELQDEQAKTTAA
jgi:hypothetical protein